jgi:hypothetical protein
MVAIGEERRLWRNDPCEESGAVLRFDGSARCSTRFGKEILDLSREQEPADGSRVLERKLTNHFMLDA